MPLTFYNEKSFCEETIRLEFHIMQECKYDIIIGIQDIMRYDLIYKNESLFRCKENITSRPLVRPLVRPEPVVPGQNPMLIPSGRVSMLEETQKVEHISKFIDRIEEAEGIPFKDESPPWERIVDGDEQFTGIPEKIYGKPEEKEQIKKLCWMYRDIFSTELRSEPANITPMELPVDQKAWEEIKTNKCPPRPQTILKQQETYRQVNIMAENNVIKTSEANKFCQVMLTPKPNNKWRFCVDFSPLNLVCKYMGWPIPNIEEMLIRIGNAKSKYFGVMDLTSGYHQAPLRAMDRIYTAFITFMGVFEWLRVPMGLKGAPAYFQKTLATEVLKGLIYTKCELYIDDILIHAKTFEEYLSRMEEVFKRLQQHKLTVNPTKCKFGLQEIEYVGHVINEHGRTFSEEKRENVFNIPKPIIGKQLKSFIGCAEYFHNHIRDFSAMMKPLHMMITDYDKNRRLAWTPESEKSYNDIRTAIRQCPTLYFPHPHAPIFLHTDASDYGIGGYLYQKIDGEDKPIAFMSKTLSGAELGWSTIEKECYAIVYSLKKFEHLIRDVQFTIRTDHKNLTYVNDSLSAKVRRWKFLIQEYDFFVEYIKGEDNFVADAFSRLVPLEDKTVLCLLDEFKIPQDKYKIISGYHNSRVGHFGVEKTLQKIQNTVDTTTGETKSQTWPYIREHVKRFIRTCPCCQKMSQLKTPIRTRNYTVAAYEPMERLYIDSIGPLKSDENGNKHILVVIDAFTRWTSLYPIKDVTAKSAAEVLHQHSGIYGQSSQYTSDNGPQFVNQIIAELFEIMGAEHVRTVAYSHEENGIVERANKEVMRHLRALIMDDKSFSQWGRMLPIVQRIMNASEHESIGVAPYRLLFGKAIDLDRNMYLPISALNIEERHLSDWADQSLRMQTDLLEKAKKRQISIDEAHLTKRTKNDAEVGPEWARGEFAVGSMVLADYPDTGMGKKPPHKLMMPKRGPFEVISNDRDKRIYTVRDLASGELLDLNVHFLRPYYYHPELHNPREVALVDKQYFDVETILASRGKPTRKKSLYFQVKWAGKSKPNWEPWENLRNNLILHTYLRNRGGSWAKIIPKKFI